MLIGQIKDAQRRIMDPAKDIQRARSPLSPFFDETPLRTNPFGNNNSAERLYRRSERVVAALHLLTNHIGPNEPARALVRKSGLEILRSALALRDGLRAEGSRHLDTFRALIRYSISLVRMLAVSGLVSSQNVQTMMDALDELGNFVNISKRSPLSEGIVFSKDDLLDIGQPVREIKDIKDTQMVKDRDMIKDTKEVSVRDSASTDLSVRKQGIIEILRSGRELGIRDIASNLPEYSEKMIQRELASLVSEGKVKKLGSKRWSRYTISPTA